MAHVLNNSNRPVPVYLDQHGVSYKLTEDFSSVLSDADAFYMTRLQDEWDDKDGGDKKSINVQGYSLTKENMSFLQPHAIVMHPLPRRQEISSKVDNDPRAMYWRQVRNGMWIRAALLAMIFDVTDNIFRIKDTFGENES
ncbi:MAG: hypothetical protein Q7J85_11090 [Bacillota bacterium]|nr:hypothetical protein [Bacillota bacterium]